MRDRLFSLFGVESGEGYILLLVLTQSVFLGIFLGAFDISAHSIFLSVFDEKMLAKGYIVSGLTGIILISLYNWFQNRMKFRNLALLNLIVVTAVTLILWISLILTPGKWTIFLVFIMLGPLNILAVMGFRGTTGRLFAISKGKRLFSVMDAGLIVGIIIICFAIPVLLSFDFALHNFLLISALSVFLAAIIQIMIGSGIRLVDGTSDSQPEIFIESKSLLSVFREDHYTRILGIIIVLSVVSAFFIQYSFMAVTRVRYPAEEDMARFLGIFTGSMMILTLLAKLLLFSYLLKHYGLRICLAISPVLVAGFTALAIVSGMVMGYTPETAGGFMIFFILLALTRLLSKSMKESIEASSFKAIYKTIDEKIRYEVHSFMEGTVNEVAAFSAGLLLAGIGVLSFIKVIHFSWVLFIIILVWLFVAFRLYSEYRRSIRKSLERAGTKEITSNKLNEQVAFKNRFYGERAFKMDYFSLISADFSLFEKMENRYYFKKIIDHTISKHDISLLPIVKKMAGSKIDEEIRQRAAEMVKNGEELTVRWKKEDEKIISAKRSLSGIRMPQTTEILRLLRDKSVESKRLAIHMIGKFQLSDMLPEVCECLNIPGLETDTVSVLRSFGRSAENELISFYLVSSGNINTSKTILRLLAKSPSKESTGFLFSRLWSNSRQLKEIALKFLIDCDFKPSVEDKERLHQFISDIIGLLTWNLSAKRCLENNNDTILLEEINKEADRWNRFLFNILSITYNYGTIASIRENLDCKTVESVSFAREVIDIIIDDSIKGKIISLLDVVPDDEKLKNLNQFFPVEIPLYNKLLDDIINRDYNLLSLWTKACVLRYLSGITDDEMTESVVALLFSPEGILREEAARLIGRSNRELYRSVYNRIPVTVRKHLYKIVNGEIDEKEFLFEKIRFLSGCFTGILEDELLSLARYMIYTRYPEVEFSLLQDAYILWTLSPGSVIRETNIIYSAKSEDLLEKVNTAGDTSYYILPLNAVEEFLYQFPDNTNTILKYLDNSEK